MKLGLTTEHAGQNTTVTIERGRDSEIAEYANVYHSKEGN